MCTVHYFWEGLSPLEVTKISLRKRQISPCCEDEFTTNSVRETTQLYNLKKIFIFEGMMVMAFLKLY